MNDAQTRKIVFWTVGNDHETLWTTTIAEALENELIFNDDTPETVTVHGWARSDRPKLDPRELVEHVLEWLDTGQWETFCDPENPTEATPLVRVAAKNLCQALDSIPCWACEIVEKRRVNVSEELGR